MTRHPRRFSSAQSEGQPDRAGPQDTRPRVLVAVVDDDRMLLDGFTCWLETVPSALEVIATAPDVATLVQRWPDPAPDVVLLDIRLRDGSDPANNVQTLVARGTAVLAMSSLPEPAPVLSVLTAGAAGVITKDHDLATLIDAVVQIAAGRTAWTPETAAGWLSDRRPDRPHLAAQERAVLSCYASGMTLVSAARSCGISPTTAKTYLDRVRDKYDIAGRTARTKLELADRAREDGHLPT